MTRPAPHHSTTAPALDKPAMRVYLWRVNLSATPLPDPRLAALAEQAEHYANHMMTGAGSVPPTVIAETGEGLLFCMPSSLEDAAAKDRFALLARMVAVGHGARALATVVEAWARLAQPAEAADRQEVVMVMLEDNSGNHGSRLLPILRNADGGFNGFGTARDFNTGAAEGRFAKLMPAHPPTPDEVAAAKATLLEMGVCVLRAGHDPSAN